MKCVGEYWYRGMLRQLYVDEDDRWYVKSTHGRLIKIKLEPWKLISGCLNPIILQH
jgi:hypothetical protein